MEKQKDTFDVLLIEDDDDHAEVIEFYITESFSYTGVKRIYDGERAMAYIKEHENGMNSLPDVILLDLKLPRFDGHEILVELKRSHRLKQIPVVVFTTSNSHSDVEKALKNCANSYIVKPMEPEKFKEVIKMIIAYWKLNERIKEKG